MHNNIFKGRDLALDVYSAGHPISIVTFEARNKYLDALKPGAFGPGFGKGRFAPQGFNEFIIRRSRNHWYQTSEMLAVAEIVNSIAHGTKVITYGGSMGGFAAINFSPLLNSDVFIALSPLYDIQQGNEAGDTRWDDEGRLLDFQYNFIRAGACRDSKGYAFFCAEGPDASHAKLIQRETCATLVPVSFGGHPCSFYLNDTYKLKRLVSEIASGDFDLARFYEVLNQRTLETHYPYERASLLKERSGNIAEAIHQARIAVSKNDGLKRLHVRLGNLLLKEGDLDGAEMAFQRAVKMPPVDPIAHIRLSYVYAARRNFDNAVAEMERAIAIDPNRAEYHVRLGEWLVRRGDLAAAERAMMRAIELKPDAVVAPVRLKAIRLKMGALSILGRLRMSSGASESG